MTGTATTSGAPVRARDNWSGALARRWPTALGAIAAVNSLVLLARFPAQVHTWVSAWCLLLAAVIYLTWGAVRDEYGHRRLLTAQTAAVLGLGAVAMTAVTVTPDAARYVLAAGWLAHAAWDLVHHRIGRVVPRWYAETCLVADLTVAAALLTVGLL
jgi:hypothetical protein